MATIHPELLEQLEAAGSQPVQAVFRLQSPENPDEKLAPDETSTLAEAVLDRAAAHFGRSVARANVLSNVGVLVVEADPTLLRWLLEQDEIASASPNKTAESPFIPPIKKRPVE
jgi:hypothetical protein